MIVGYDALFDDDRVSSPSQFILNSIDDPAYAVILPISYRVYLVDYSSVETFAASPMIITILDPCKSPTATVTSPTLTDQLQYVGDPSQTYAITPFTVYAAWCAVTYSATSNEPTLDSAIFTFDAVTQTFTILSTDDVSLAGTPSALQKDYTITVTA